MDTSTVIAATDTLGRRIAPRRFRTLQEKRRIVAEANVPGVSVAEVARRHGVNANLIFGWKRQDKQGVLGRRSRRGAVKLLPVRVSVEPGEQRTEPARTLPAGTEGRIEITLAGDIRIAVIGAVPVERLERLLVVLRRPS